MFRSFFVQCTHLTDRQTDRRTDRQTYRLGADIQKGIENTVRCITCSRTVKSVKCFTLCCKREQSQHWTIIFKLSDKR